MVKAKAKTQKHLFFTLSLQKLIAWIVGGSIIVGLIAPALQNLIRAHIWQLGLTNVSISLYLAAMFVVGFIVAKIKKWQLAPFYGAVLALIFTMLYEIVSYLFETVSDHYQWWNYINSGHRTLIELAISLVAAFVIFVAWRRKIAPIETRSFWWFLSLLSVVWLAVQAVAMIPAYHNMAGIVRFETEHGGWLGGIDIVLVLYAFPLVSVLVYLLNLLRLWSVKSGALRLMLAGLGVALFVLAYSNFLPFIFSFRLSGVASLVSILSAYVIAAAVNGAFIHYARKSIRA